MGVLLGVAIRACGEGLRVVLSGQNPDRHAMNCVHTRRDTHGGELHSPAHHAYMMRVLFIQTGLCMVLHRFRNESINID